MKITLPTYFKANIKPKYVIYNIDQSQYLHQKHFHKYYELLSLDGHNLSQHAYDAYDISSDLINASSPHFLFTKTQAEYCVRCFRSIVGTHALQIIPVSEFKYLYSTANEYVIFQYDKNIKNHTGLYNCLVDPLHQELRFKPLNREDVVYDKDTYSGRQLELLKHLLSSAKLNYIVVDYTAFRTAYQND